MDHPETIGTEPPSSFSRREFLTQARSQGIAAAALPWLAHRFRLKKAQPCGPRADGAHSVDESAQPVNGRTETETVRSGYPKCHTFALQTGLCPGGNVLRETRAGIPLMDNEQPRSHASAALTRRTP